MKERSTKDGSIWKTIGIASRFGGFTSIIILKIINIFKQGELTTMDKLFEVLLTTGIAIITAFGGLAVGYIHQLSKRLKESKIDNKEHKNKIHSLETELKTHIIDRKVYGYTDEEKKRIASILENLDARISKIEKKELG